MDSLVRLIEEQSGLHFRRQGRQLVGPCPFCAEGHDRFQIWPEIQRFWCRRCRISGDAIEFLRRYCGMTFAQARERVSPHLQIQQKGDNHHNRAPAPEVRHEKLTPPPINWRQRAEEFTLECAGHLLGKEHLRPRQWLEERTLTLETMTAAGLGYNPSDCYEARARWGLDEPGGGRRPDHLWLPRGITIPWILDGELWGVRIRRPVGRPKYYWIPGGAPTLYRADQGKAAQPVVLVEGELDALTLVQLCGDRVAAMATGSTHGGRHLRFIARLAAASVVLLAFDHDEAGDSAAVWWLQRLPNALRWKPYWSDPNDMACSGADLNAWLRAGLITAGLVHKEEDHE